MSNDPRAGAFDLDEAMAKRCRGEAGAWAAYLPVLRDREGGGS